jgi:membrane-bound lytic murein transglycosylase
VDRELVPPGASTLIDVKKFGAAKGSCPRISTFAIAQDTGGAILGAHVDWYFGAGAAAGSVAGKMNNAGSFYVAVPRGSGHAIAGCQ